MNLTKNFLNIVKRYWILLTILLCLFLSNNPTRFPKYILLNRLILITVYLLQIFYSFRWLNLKFKLSKALNFIISCFIFGLLLWILSFFINWINNAIILNTAAHYINLNQSIQFQSSHWHLGDVSNLSGLLNDIQQNLGTSFKIFLGQVIRTICLTIPTFVSVLILTKLKYLVQKN